MSLKEAIDDYHRGFYISPNRFDGLRLLFPEEIYGIFRFTKDIQAETVTLLISGGLDVIIIRIAGLRYDDFCYLE